MRKVMLAAAAALVVTSMSAGGVGAASAPRAATAPQAHPAVAAAGSNADWIEFHHDASRAGYDANEPTFSTLSPSWSASTLIGEIYASPLVYGSTVYAATEDNYIYALDVASGSVLWSVRRPPECS